MRRAFLRTFVLPALFLVACGGQGPTTETPSTPAPTLPGVPTTPVPTPVEPEPNPTPTPGGVPYYGEWIITYTSEYGVSFVHALQVTTDVSDDGLRNAGGGLQEFCTGGSGDECEGVYGSGIGFIGNLELDDGTAPLTLVIATSYSGETPYIKILTLEDIQMTTNNQNQRTFTADAGWQLSTGDLDFGSITATNVGAPKQLQPLKTSRIDRNIEDIISEASELF